MAKRGGLKRQHLTASKAENANEETEAPKSPKKRRVTVEEPTDFGNYLDTERLRGFKCPKKGEDAPNLESVPVNRQTYMKEIKPILERSFKTQEFFHSFVVNDCCFLRNKRHEHQYTEKKTELRQNAHTPKELQKVNDHFGFVFAKNKNQILKWCKEGLCIGNASISHLGESSSGVSLSQFVDLVCPTTSLPKEGWICIVKYFKGRAKHVSPCASPLEPQPNHDCHLTNPTSHFSSGRLKENDDVALSNQIFLFEYNEDAELVQRPRHVLPHAAVQYTFEISATAALQARDTNDPKMNRYRLLLQKDRLNQLNETPGKTFLNNRQHPGVPLTEVRPRPPKLGCRTTQDLFSSGSLFSGPSKHRRPKPKAVEKPEKPREPKRVKKKKEEAPPIEEKAPEVVAEPPPPPPPTQPEAAAPKAKTAKEETAETLDRTERLAPNVGKAHFSGGFIVSVVRLKVGSKFQGKLDLVSYADKVVYPLVVLSHKLSVRRFLTTTSLLSNELQGVCVSLKNEFMLSDGIHYGSYYRFYLRPSTPSMVPLSHLIEYMQKRQKVAAITFPMDDKTMLMFPDGEFASTLGIPPLDNSSGTQTTLFLHCLLVSSTPRYNYFSCLREPIVSPDVQRVDEVLASYIWSDMDLPPVDEEAAQLQGSYGGVWPCAEALTQLLNQMNEVQNKYFRHILGKSPENLEPLAYQPLDFTRETRQPVISTASEPDLQRISELISKKELKEVLANVEKNEKEMQEALAGADLLKRRVFKETKPEPNEDLEADAFEEDVTERRGDWRDRRKDIHCGLGNILRSMQETPSSPPPLVDCESQRVCDRVPVSSKEPQMVRYSKTVFEDPPSSPPQVGLPDLDATKYPGDTQASVMTNQLARINAEMKELGSSSDPQAEALDSTACFGKILNVIRNSMFEKKESKEDFEAVTSAPEAKGSFDGYDIQNRAAEAARKLSNQNEDQVEAGGINDWYMDYYRKAIAQSKAATTEPAVPKSSTSLPVPSGWARRNGSAADINDDEIHQILEEGMEDEEEQEKEKQNNCLFNKSSTDPPSTGNFSSPVPSKRKDLRFLRRTPQTAGPSKVSEDKVNNEDFKATQSTMKDGEALFSIRKLDDARMTLSMSKDENPNAQGIQSLLKNKMQLKVHKKDDEGLAGFPQRRLNSPSLRSDVSTLLKKAMASPSSSMSISSTDDVEAEAEGSHIPVMVNRRFTGPPSPPQTNGIVVPNVLPPIALGPLGVPTPILVPDVSKESTIFADPQVTKRAL